MWIEKQSGTTAPLNSIIWAGSQYVAAGANGTICLSKDGTVWENRTSGITGPLYASIWTGSRIIVAGRNGLYASSNGITWERLFSGTDFWHCITYSSTLIVAGKEGNVSGASTDGETWKSHRIDPVDGILQFQSIAWSGRQFVAVGIGNNGLIFSWGAIYTSTDGLIWANWNYGNPNYLNCVIWANNQFVAVGDNGAIYTSPEELIAVRPEVSPKVPLTVTSLRVSAKTTGSNLMVNFSGFLKGKTARLQLVSISGRCLVTQHVATTGTIALPIGNLSAGMYFIRAESDGVDAVCPVIISR
jgi:hypothetical protein